jgi:predicted glycogen debranching enzyme
MPSITSRTNVDTSDAQLLSEWLETDGLGGFASGTVSGVRTRRYHGWLNTTATPPDGRTMLVNGVEAWVETASGTFALTSHSYAPGVVHPDGSARIESFECDPWPHWTFRLENGARVVQQVFAHHGSTLVAVSWKLLGGDEAAELCVRPLISGRDPHALHHENPALNFEAETFDHAIRWRPYDSLPGILCASNARYEYDPVWYRNFLYSEERERGFDFLEDLASPGVLRFDRGAREAVMILALDTPSARERLGARSAEHTFALLRKSESERRGRFESQLDRAADAYIVKRGAGKTIIAGYPWFGDWGRDTFIALRGVCLATGRLEDARSILLGWADVVSEGMLPNRFSDRDGIPEFNSVDAPLWFTVAVHEYFAAAAAADVPIVRADRKRLMLAIDSILDGYARGTRYGIRMDEDGLLAAGARGVQLTWMDAKVGDEVITPRSGKPVEIQALWLNALRIGASFSARWRDPFERGQYSFQARFWNASRGWLYDVVDENHEPGRNDATLRPNQILAVGGLPYALLEGERARAVVDVVERKLLTPVGLRSLDPDDLRYARCYEGSPRSRDVAYHQGTVWPWLIGPFVEAWVRLNGATDHAKRKAREKYLAPLLATLDGAGLGHLSEIADGNPPHAMRGCPFQAWSVAEALRLDRVVLTTPRPRVVAEEDTVIVPAECVSVRRNRAAAPSRRAAT